MPKAPSSQGSRNPTPGPSSVARRGVTSISRKRVQQTTLSVWLGEETPKPDQQAIASFDALHSQTPDDQSWKLTRSRHALSVMAENLLVAVELRTTIFDATLPSGGLFQRVTDTIKSRVCGKFDGLVGKRMQHLLQQLAYYGDAFDDNYQEFADLKEYKELGLAKVLPGHKFAHNSILRKVCIKMLTAILLLDRFLSAALFYADQDASLTRVQQISQAYQDAPPSHIVYSSDFPIDSTSNNIYQACRDVLNWRKILPLVHRRKNDLDASDGKNETYSTGVDRMMRKVNNAELSAFMGTLEANIFRVAVSAATLFGQVYV